MVRYVQEFDERTLYGLVPEFPRVVSVPGVEHGHEVVLYQVKLSVKVEVETLQESFPKVASSSMMAVSRQVMLKKVGNLLCHAFWHLVVMGGGVDFSGKFDGEGSMYIKMVMFDVEAMNEGEEERVSNDDISSVVGEGVRRSASALVINPSPSRRHGSEVSPSVVGFQ